MGLVSLSTSDTLDTGAFGECDCPWEHSMALLILLLLLAIWWLRYSRGRARVVHADADTDADAHSAPRLSFDPLWGMLCCDSGDRNSGRGVTVCTRGGYGRCCSRIQRSESVSMFLLAVLSSILPGAS